MAVRKYSVAEIDQMRRTLRGLFHSGYEFGDREDALRTYMLNGTDPQELTDAALARREKMNKP